MLIKMTQLNIKIIIFINFLFYKCIIYKFNMKVYIFYFINTLLHVLIKIYILIIFI